MTEDLFISLLLFLICGVEVPWHCVQGKCSTKPCSVRDPGLGLTPNAYSTAQLVLGTVKQSAYG